MVGKRGALRLVGLWWWGHVKVPPHGLADTYGDLGHCRAEGVQWKNCSVRGTVDKKLELNLF